MFCTCLTDFDEPPLAVIRIENAGREAEVPRNPLPLYSRSRDYDFYYDYLSECDVVMDWHGAFGVMSGRPLCRS